MFSIQISGDNLNALRVDLQLINNLFNGPVGVDATTTTTASALGVEQPTRKPRAKKAETVEQAAPSAAPAADLFASSEPAPEPAKEPEQKDLIAAFRALNDKKGTDEIVKLLTKYGAKTVALIPKANWAEAIDLANKAAA